MQDYNQVVMEQDAAFELWKSEKLSYREIAKRLGISKDAAWRRINAAQKRSRLDPELAERLKNKGIVDLAGLHSGWLLEKDKDGSGSSLYFYLGQDQERVSFADAVVDVLQDIPKLEPISKCNHLKHDKGNATWLVLADLHVGGDYGDPRLEEDFNDAIDDLTRRLPPAAHAVLFELGDLLEMNDHKGITPGSGNHLEVKIGTAEYLKSVQLAVKLIRRALHRLLETHDTVEAHFIKGNHDPSAHVAVMLALAEHFSNNPRIQIHVTDEEFRVVSWGECAAFPHHGDTLKWPVLKDVFADQFPDAWAQAKAHRHIMTAHFHHDRKIDLVGAVAEHFRTLHGPNKWAKSKGLFSRGSLTAITVHKSRGEEYRTISNIKNTTPR